MTPRVASLLLLFVLLLAATALSAQQNERLGVVSLTIGPANLTLNAGQTQRFSARLTGAPAATTIVWAVKEQSGANISQDGIFKGRAMGIYHVIAFATIDGTTLTHAVAKVTVVTHSDGSTFR